MKLIERVRGSRVDEQGTTLVLVMAVSFFLMLVTTTTVRFVQANASIGARYVGSVQSRFAAEAGVNVLNSDVVAATKPTALPCSVPKTTLATGRTAYSDAITYYNSNGVALACPLTAWPATFAVVSKGTDTQGSPLSMTEDAAITPPTSAKPTLKSAYGNGIFSKGTIAIQNTIKTSPNDGTAPANLVTNTTFRCSNTSTVNGSIYAYSTKTLTINGTCTFTGGFYANGGIKLTNKVHVGGNLESYEGTSGINMTVTAKIGGNATAVKGPITLDNSTVVVGNAYAAGAITYKGDSSCCKGTIDGSIIKPHDGTALKTQAMPQQPTFPSITNALIKSTYKAAGYTTLKSIPSATCTKDFGRRYTTSKHKTVEGYFSTWAKTETKPTVYDAPTCTVHFTMITSPTTWSMAKNTMLVVKSVQTSGHNIFKSTTKSSIHSFSLIVPAPGTGGITFSNTTTLTSTLNTVVYTEGRVAVNTKTTMTGEILAGTGFTGSNTFTLYASSAGASFVPGALTTSGSTAKPASVTVERRYTT